MQFTRLRPQNANSGRNAKRDMVEEVKAYKLSTRRQNDLKAFLYELYLLRSGNTQIKQLLRNSGFDECTLSTERLHSLYAVAIIHKLKKKVDTKYETYATRFEIGFISILKDLTKSKIYRGYWMGNHCVDFFIPKHRVAIEIDGSVHNMEAKMRKDNFKEDYLQKEFKVFVVRIENFDIRQKAFLIQKLLFETSLNSKSVKRLMRDIYISTISAHLTVEELQKYIHPAFKSVFEQFLKTRSLLRRRRGRKC